MKNGVQPEAVYQFKHLPALAHRYNSIKCAEEKRTHR